MSTTVKSDFDKKKENRKLGFFNGFLNRIIPSNFKPKLQTDAVPSNNNSQRIVPYVDNGGNQNSQASSIVPASNTQIVLTPPTQAARPILHHPELNQLNQNMTVIESQVVTNFSHINGLHIGNTYIAEASLRKNSCNGSNDDRTIHKQKTRSVVGKRTLLEIL